MAELGRNDGIGYVSHKRAAADAALGRENRYAALTLAIAAAR